MIMILFDMSALAFEAKFAVGNDIDMLRSYILLKVLHFKQKYREFGDPVLIYDAGNYWRNDLFEHYKWSRKNKRMSDSEREDFKEFFSLYSRLIDEFKENLPCVNLRIDRCEADDIIATLCHHRNDDKMVLISGDKDYKQLHPLIKVQESPHFKRGIIESDGYDLFHHICRGDDSDGIPNIVSPSDCFKNSVRQKALLTTTINEWKKNEHDPQSFCESLDMLERFNTNRQLIDLSLIPAHIKEIILQAFDNAEIARGKTMNYLIANRLSKVIEIGGF